MLYMYFGSSIRTMTTNMNNKQ